MASRVNVPLCTVHVPAPYIWVRRNGDDLAKITKEWGGLPRELLTVADHFTHRVLWPTGTRAASLGHHRPAAFAIDLEYFENRGRRGGFRPGNLAGHGFDSGGFTGRGF